VPVEASIPVPSIAVPIAVPTSIPIPVSIPVAADPTTIGEGVDEPTPTATVTKPEHLSLAMLEEIGFLDE
jgi:hypothetical protein